MGVNAKMLYTFFNECVHSLIKQNSCDIFEKGGVGWFITLELICMHIIQNNF